VSDVPEDLWAEFWRTRPTTPPEGATLGVLAGLELPVVEEGAAYPEVREVPLPPPPADEDEGGGGVEVTRA
jgi:hypothetical protein